MTKVEKQPSLNVYNAYKDGLFGHHHTKLDLMEMDALNLASYEKSKKDFSWFCSVIGGRVLYAMDESSILVTPWKMEKDLVNQMSKVWGIDGNNVTMVSLDERTDVGYDEDATRDLPAEILDKNAKMDELRRWVNGQTEVPVLSPRTITEHTIQMAKELGVGHIHTMPDIPGLANKTVDKVYPTAEYIEKHLAQVNNSKAENYTLLKQLDLQLGTEYAPKGGVAYSVDEVVRIADELTSQGCQVMIKADLAVDGQGNMRVKDGDVGRDCPGRTYAELSYLERVTYMRKLLSGGYLGEGEDSMMLVGKKAPVVVCEFLDRKICDPSVEVYTPPMEWNIDPQIYYDCGMIIQKGGFAGSIIDDPIMGVNKSNLDAVGKYILPPIEKGKQNLIEIEELCERREEYVQLMDRAKEMVLAMALIKQREGYVGISDCDFALCIDSQRRMYIKILEFNFNRETGGTATYHIGQRLSKGLGKKGYAVARDGIGKNLGEDFAQVQRWSEESGLDYLQNGRRGLLVLGRRPDGGIMSLVFARDLDEALRIDTQLKAATMP